MSGTGSEQVHDDGWGEEEPLSSDIFSEFKPLRMPATIDDLWPNSFHMWALRVDKSIFSMAKTVEAIQGVSTQVLRAVETVRGCFSAHCRATLSFLLRSEWSQEASPIAKSIDQALPEEIGGQLHSGDITGAWSKLRVEMRFWMRELHTVVEQLAVLPALAVPVEELKRLTAWHSVIPLFQLTTERRGQRIAVYVDGIEMHFKPNAVWFLATCGQVGFESEDYRHDSIEDMWESFDANDYPDIGRLAVRANKPVRDKPKQYGKYKLAAGFRSMILPPPGPELERVQAELERLINLQKKR